MQNGGIVGLWRLTIVGTITKSLTKSRMEMERLLNIAMSGR
jgi:hypothetical protein